MRVIKFENGYSAKRLGALIQSLMYILLLRNHLRTLWTNYTVLYKNSSLFAEIAGNFPRRRQLTISTCSDVCFRLEMIDFMVSMFTKGCSILCGVSGHIGHDRLPWKAEPIPSRVRVEHKLSVRRADCSRSEVDVRRRI